MDQIHRDFRTSKRLPKKLPKRLQQALGQVLIVKLFAFGLGQAPVVGQPQVIPPDPSPTDAQVIPAPGITRPTLQIGSQGNPVSELQALLKLLGYYEGPVDGVYQESLAVAVSVFQRAANLRVDGVVGPATWERLLPPLPQITDGTPVQGGAVPISAGISPSPTASPAPAASPAPTPAPAEPAPSSPAAPATRPASPAAPSMQATPVDFPILRLGMQGPAVVRLQERLQSAGFFQGAVDGIFGPATRTAVQAAQRNFTLEPDGVVGPATWTALLR